MNPEDEYLLLRKRLDSLGYRHPLGIESLPLVDVLLSDLLTTTQSLKQTKLRNLNKNSSSSSQPSKEALQTAIAPFKTDNARLLRENNDLCQKLIKTKDEQSGKYRDYKQKLRKLENENVDLKRLNDTYIKAAESLERESKTKSVEIQRLQEKSLQTVVEMPNKENVNARAKNSIRRQRIQLDSELKPGKIRNTGKSFSQKEIDVMRLADHRIECLQNEVKDLKNDIKNYQLERDSFDEKLIIREAEISRLRRELTGGRPEDIVTIEAKCQASDRLIGQLNSQLELTQKANSDLEVVISENQGKIDQVSHQADERLQELRAAQAEVQRLTLQLTNAGQDRMIARETSSKFKEQKFSLEQKIADLTAQNKRLQELFEGVRNDNGVLTEQLRNNQHIELEKIYENKFYLNSKELTPQKLNHFIKSIEDERDELKLKNDSLQNELKKKLSENAKNPENTPKSPKSPKSGPRRQISGKSDTYHPAVVSDPLKKSDEFLAVIRQRDDLQLALERFEAHMSEIQANVRTVTRERDNALKESLQLRQELDSLRNSLASEDDSDGINLQVMKKLEVERNNAQDKLRELVTIKDSLEERYKAHEKRHFEERARLEQEIEDLNAKLQSALSDSGEYRKHKKSKNSRVDNLLAEREALTTRTRQLEQALDNNDKHITVLNRQIESGKVSIVQLEQRLDEYRLTSERLRGERDNLMVEKKNLSRNVTDLSNKFMKAEQMQKRAKAGLTALDRDKDSIQNALDEKTEILARTEQQLRRVENQLREEQEMNHGVRNHNDRVSSEIMSKERELVSVRRQLENAQNDFTREAKIREEVQRQVQKISEDLGKVENDRRSKEIEIDEAKRKLNEKDGNIGELNRLLKINQDKGKVDEEDKKAWKDRCDAIDNERIGALNELGKIREQKILLETELRNIRVTLDMQKENQNAMNSEIEQHLKTEEEYDRQNQRLNTALANAEDKIIELGNQLRVGNENVVHLREMNARLQNDLDTQFTQHTQYKMVSEKSAADIGELKQSYDAAKHELEAEQAHARELELLVQKSRHKEFEIQLDAAQLKEELLQERDRANHSEQQVQLYERQVTEQAARLNEMEQEIETTKRMLTNERYERERTAQILKQTTEINL